jgi:hypothetical protein
MSCNLDSWQHKIEQLVAAMLALTSVHFACLPRPLTFQEEIIRFLFIGPLRDGRKIDSWGNMQASCGTVGYNTMEKVEGYNDYQPAGGADRTRERENEEKET